jgi:hypothetical protein
MIYDRQPYHSFGIESAADPAVIMLLKRSPDRVREGIRCHRHDEC